MTYINNKTLIQALLVALVVVSNNNKDVEHVHLQWHQLKHKFVCENIKLPNCKTSLRIPLSNYTI